MVQSDAQVRVTEPWGPFVRVAFSAPEISAQLEPGRFVLADLGDYLRTPLFPAWLDGSGFATLVPPDHPAACLQPGASVNLIGPLGRGFKVPTSAQSLLLVADSPHLPALLSLAVPAPPISRSVVAVLTAATAADLYPIRLLPPAMEVYVATADGSVGRQGTGLDLLPSLVRWADCICIADDPARYPALADMVWEVRISPPRRLAQALIAPTMACGVGVCQGCAVRVERGFRRACTDGPVFDLLELR